MTISELVTLIEHGGVVALLVLILVGGARQVWVFGWLYRQAIMERDQWKELALKSTDFLDRASRKAKPRP